MPFESYSLFDRHRRRFHQWRPELHLPGGRREYDLGPEQHGDGDVIKRAAKIAIHTWKLSYDQTMVNDERDLMLDANVLAKGIDPFAQSGHDLAVLSPTELTLDFNLVEKLEVLVRSLRPARKNEAFPHFVPHANVVYMSACQLGPLQEYRQELANREQLLAEDLRSIDLLYFTAHGAVTAIEAKVNEPQGTDVPSIYGNFFAPSLPLPSTQTQYLKYVRDDLYTLISALDHASVIVQNALFLCRSEARYVNGVIAKLLRIAFSGLSLFCSVPWFHRRWFVFHGARPPRPSVQATLSLFTGACSGPRLAY
jgi:hypothetical protein